MEQHPQLLVYKASAGSGKTFTLAVHYIRQLIEDPYAYRRILAVTFTNKATAEMKHCYGRRGFGRLPEGDSEDIGQIGRGNPGIGTGGVTAHHS